MTTPIPETPLLQQRDFASAVVDALSSHICIIDQDGLIIAVNRAWRDFEIENPPVSTRSGVGARYLDICRSAHGPGSEEAGEIAVGIQSVLEGRTELFQIEYPCHSPMSTDGSWRVSPRSGSSSEAR